VTDVRRKIQSGQLKPEFANLESITLPDVSVYFT